MPDDPRALDDPRLLAFAPLLYVAWSDGELTAGELDAICSELEASEELDGTCQEYLAAWLDPADPPSAGELRRLLTAVRRVGDELDAGERRSLADLGAELARAGGHEPSAAERRALERIQGALGVFGPEASRGLLVVERPRPEPARPEPSFDPGELARLLQPDHRELRREVMELLREPGMRPLMPGELPRDEYRELVLERCRELAERGWGSLSYPEEHGGRDDTGGFIAVFESLAHGDLSVLVKFGVQFGLFGGSILQLGSERHHAEYLPPAGRLELPGCFAMTETGHGSNVQELRTVARFDRDRDAFVVDTPRAGAGKDYIGNAALHARLATVFAQLEIDGEGHGVHAFLVPIRDDAGQPLRGVRIEDCGPKMGLEGVDNGRLWFDRVEIPRGNLLDRFAAVDGDGEYSSPIASPGKRFFTMLGTLVGGRVSVALAGLSAARVAQTIAVRYALRRRQFGPAGEAEVPLMEYLSHQRRLLPDLARTYALTFALRDLARRYVALQAGGPGGGETRDEEEQREIESLAAGLKALATWHATAVIQEGREACGGQGYLSENRFAALKADSDVFTTFEGDNTVLLQLVARSLLSGFKKQFSEMDLLGMVRYLGSRATTAITELNPIVTRSTDEGHLRSADFHRAALGWREEHLLTTVARRLKSRIDAGAESFDAMVECQLHLLELGRAHVERFVHERFADAIAELADDDPRRGALESLRQLHALARIEADRGWFQENGYLEEGKSKAIRSLVNDLCGEVKDEALGLVEAFEIPDELLAPIAR